MSTFNLPDVTPTVPVHLIENLSQEDLLNFPAFKTWLSSLTKSLSLQSQKSHAFHADPYALRSITIQSADFFGGKRLGFLKFQAEITNADGERLPGSVFLRGGSLCMMLVLRPVDNKEEKYVVVTVQPRIPAGSLAFKELPAGMLDDSGTFAGGAAQEIKEEVGLEVPADELVDMTKLALGGPRSDDDDYDDEEEEEEKLQQAVYPSPGGSDEFIPIFLWEKDLERPRIEALKGKLTGIPGTGEKITLKIVPLEDLWTECARDGKTLAAWALYHALKQNGKLK